MSRIKIGPESAGADPGPACYGLGGRDATVSDADLVLGYLDPVSFTGGRVVLDRGAAARGEAGAHPEVSAAAGAVTAVLRGGRGTPARAVEESPAQERPLGLQQSGDSLTSICALSVASLAVGDGESASALYELLLPYADHCTLFLAAAG